MKTKEYTVVIRKTTQYEAKIKVNAIDSSHAMIEADKAQKSGALTFTEVQKGLPAIHSVETNEAIDA